MTDNFSVIPLIPIRKPSLDSRGLPRVPTWHRLHIDMVADFSVSVTVDRTAAPLIPGAGPDETERT
jgi:hypothetical protein